MKNLTIKCPNCGEVIDASEAFEKHAKAELEGQYQKLITKERQRADDAEKKALREKQAYEEKNANVELIIAREVEKTRKDVHEKALELATLNSSTKLEEISLENQSLKKKIEELSRQTTRTDFRGPAQEICIETLLNKEFPRDRITKIQKGTRGADILQHINAKNGVPLGSIYWESKNTVSWSNQWVDKLISDRNSRKADVGIIVSRTMPSGIDFLGQIKGIWICSPEIFVSVAYLVRAATERIHRIQNHKANQQSSAIDLQNYMMGGEFSAMVDRIIRGCELIKQKQFRARQTLDSFWAEETVYLDDIAKSLASAISTIEAITDGDGLISGILAAE